MSVRTLLSLTLALLFTRPGSAAIHDFGLNIADAVARHDGRGVANRVTSPLAEQLVFGMAANGADGETLRQLLKDLGVAPDLSATNAALKDCRAQLTSSAPTDARAPTVTFSNAAWFSSHDPGNAFNSAFEERLRQSFDAEISALDFKTPAAAKAMNQWALDKSKGLIPEIISPTETRDLDFLLANLTYFSGSWAYPFSVITPDQDPQGHSTTFHPADGSSIRAPVIYATKNFRLVDTGAEQIVELPFTGTLARDFVFYAVLPARPETDLSTYRRSEFWKDTLERMTLLPARLGTVTLPKFAFNYTVTATESAPVTLAAKLNYLFGDSANFANLNPHGARVKLFKEVARIELDEKGVKAAAAAVIGMTKRGMGPRPEFAIKLDRPFTFAIAERTTGTLLFVGELQNPLQ